MPFPHAPPRRRIPRGFTLIELLVAITLMALMATLGWRSLDGMTRAQTQLRQHADDVLALEAGLAQWAVDLDAMERQPNTTSLLWDGNTLRIVRHGSEPGAGLSVVAWTHRQVSGQGQWLRWQSDVVNTRLALQQAWEQAGYWSHNASEESRQREVRIAALDQWQIYYYINDGWSNPLSSMGTVAEGKVAATPIVPEGIRLVLSLAPGQAISGPLTRDWARPDLVSGK